MKLYYNKGRDGWRSWTFDEPKDIMPRVQLQEEMAMMPELRQFFRRPYEWWYNPALWLPMWQQLKIHNYWMGYYIAHYGAKYVATHVGYIHSMIFERIAEASVRMKWVPALTWTAVVVTGVFMIFWFLNPNFETDYEEETWGTGWTLKYKEHIWEAVFLAFDDDGLPVFMIGPEISDTVLYEFRDEYMGIESTDKWYFGGTWVQVKDLIIGWHTFEWMHAYESYIGLCHRYGQGLYKLNASYFKFVPPH